MYGGPQMGRTLNRTREAWRMDRDTTHLRPMMFRGPALPGRGRRSDISPQEEQDKMRRCGEQVGRLLTRNVVTRPAGTRR
jgi:hypothetical protein